MAIIGIFTLGVDGTLTGDLRTLTLNTRLQFVPETNKSKDSAPDFRVLAEHGMEAGAAWKKSSRDTGRTYWSVKLDDPAFTAPLYANLIGTQNDEIFHLLWSRRNGD
jgi:uncharacterized protein (DUF736 family)